MCYRTECPTCHKPTWAGCGKHIESALAGVPEADRCQCRNKTETPVQAPVSISETSLSSASSSSTHFQADTYQSSEIITLTHALQGHSDRVWSSSLHPTLPLIATASADKTVRLYSKRTFRYICSVEGNHERTIRACAWKPGETKPVLATASFDGKVGIWDCQGDEETGEGEWECAGLLEGHENEVKGVAWSSSGTLLATCSRDKAIWIWDCENYEDPECVSVMQEHSQDVKCVVWHPTEELLASGSYDDEIRLWRDDGDDWICCSVLKGHDGTVWSIDFESRPNDAATSQSQARLVSASGDGTIRIWRRTFNPTAGDRDPNKMPSIIRPNQDQIWEQEVILPASHQGDIYTVTWSRDSGRIASAGEDGNITIYEPKKQSAEYNSAGQVSAEEWVVAAQKINAHGVHEINHLVWGGVAGGKESLLSAGDDCITNVWSVSVTSQT